jgi:stage V sporulation protein S
MQSIQTRHVAAASGTTAVAEIECQRAIILRVSARSRPQMVAGAIAGMIRTSGSAEIQSIGAGATNQAIKAIAIARSYLREEGADIVCQPAFIGVAIDDETRTAIGLHVIKR